MAMQINDIVSDLDDISILQTEEQSFMIIISITIVIKSILHGEKPVNIRHIILIIL